MGPRDRPDAPGVDADRITKTALFTIATEADLDTLDPGDNLPGSLGAGLHGLPLTSR